jgi:Tfp pilus assembly protein PilF
MSLRIWLFFMSLSLLLPSIGVTGNTAQNIIEMLNCDIKQTQTNKKKSCLLIYRARQYCKIKEWDKALEDYNNALELDHKGWIHLERSHFLMNTGKYELAYQDAEAAKDEVPTLAREADTIMAAAIVEIRKEYEADNPVTILMDTQVDPSRKTRFDIMREQGVFVTKAMTSGNSARKKPGRKKQTATSCRTTKKSRG